MSETRPACGRLDTRLDTFLRQAEHPRLTGPGDPTADWAGGWLNAAARRTAVGAGVRVRPFTEGICRAQRGLRKLDGKTCTHANWATDPFTLQTTHKPLQQPTATGSNSSNCPRTNYATERCASPHASHFHCLPGSARPLALLLTLNGAPPIKCSTVGPV